MTVEKVIENGMTYRIETTENSVVKMQVDPILRHGTIPVTVNAGDVVTIPMHLEDFDGEPRNDSRDVTFIIDGQAADLPMVDGEVTLELELAARGRQRISVAPLGVTMEPFEIEVV